MKLQPMSQLFSIRIIVIITMPCFDINFKVVASIVSEVQLD